MKGHNHGQGSAPQADSEAPLGRRTVLGSLLGLSKVPDNEPPDASISLADALMSGFALFATT